MSTAGLMGGQRTVVEQTLLLTPEAAADRLSIGRSQMYELMRRGEVRSVKIGRLRRIPATSLVDYIAALQVGPGDTAA